MDVASVAPKVFIEKFPVAKDSLKFAGIEKTFSVIDEVPTSDIVKQDNEDPKYSEQIESITSTLKALQIARKSLSDAQSIAKDIKSNYKTEQNDAWAPLDDSMLRQRYEATMQIRDILANAKYKNQNVFTIDYSNHDVHLDMERKDINTLNLRDEKSITIFSDNLAKLSNQIEENIQRLQNQIDSINQNRWLSTEALRTIKIQPKDTKAQVQENVQPMNLASALAHVAANTKTKDETETLADMQKSALQDSKLDTMEATENTTHDSEMSPKNPESQTQAVSEDTSKEEASLKDVKESGEDHDSERAQADEITTAVEQVDNENKKEETEQEVALDSQDATQHSSESAVDEDEQKVIGVVSEGENERVVDLFV